MLISDSHDALTGMRLAGVEGVLAETAEQAEAEIKKCIEDETDNPYHREPCLGLQADS